MTVPHPSNSVVTDPYNRQPRGLFGPGNPGKPPGAKHRANAASWAALDGLRDKAFAVLREKLDQGDLKAALFVAARFLPDGRTVELPSASPSAWTDAMAAGDITVAEAAKAAQALKTVADTTAVREIAARLDELETLIAAAQEKRK